MRRQRARKAVSEARAAMRLQKAWRRKRGYSQPTWVDALEIRQPPMSPPPPPLPSPPPSPPARAPAGAELPPAGTPAPHHAYAVVLPLGKLPDEQTRGLYAKVANELTLRPPFRSLPEALLWPNLEVTFIVSFSSGLIACATSVIGATLSGHSPTILNLVLAILAISLVAVAYAWQVTEGHGRAGWRVPLGVP